MRKEDITRLEAFEMKVWRRMEKNSCTEHISNEVLKLVEEERYLLTIIRTRQRNWRGHTLYNDRGITSKRNNRRKNGLEMRKEKTKKKITGLDDERGIQQT